MMQEEIGRIKNDVITMFIHDPNIVDALIGPVDEDADVEYLLTGIGTGSHGHIHKYEYSPEINETADVFLNVETSIGTYPRTDTTCNIYLYVFMLCHKSMMENYVRAGAAGTRIDILYNDVCKLLNGNKSLGIGPARLMMDDIYKPTVNYYGRYATFSIPVYNRNRKAKQP